MNIKLFQKNNRNFQFFLMHLCMFAVLPKHTLNYRNIEVKIFEKQ